MTLNTRVYVQGPVDLKEMFRYCQEMISVFDVERRTADQQEWRLTPEVLMNEGGQGLPAWLMIYHGGERPCRTEEQAAACDDCCEKDCNPADHEPPSWYKVSFDTGYGYQGPSGMGCGDLHTLFVAKLGFWLDDRKVPWKWLNEFTGVVHDDYESLADLSGGGRQASAWYANVAAPAIEAHIRKLGAAE